jgi:hypothetical protein
LSVRHRAAHFGRRRLQPDPARRAGEVLLPDTTLRVCKVNGEDLYLGASAVLRSGFEPDRGLLVTATVLDKDDRRIVVKLRRGIFFDPQPNLTQ